MLTHVVCFGNAWHGDDGFGQHVLRRLPAGIPAFDAGTAGLNALGYFEGCDKAVIVDAVRTGARPRRGGATCPPVAASASP